MSSKIRVTVIFVLAAVLSYRAGTAQELLVRYRPELRDLEKNVINSIATSEDFWLYMFVEDLRTKPFGVFAAFADVTYDSALASDVNGMIEHLPTYDTVPSGEVFPGLIDEVGGLDGFELLGGGEFGVFRLLMRSGDSFGDITFATDPADDKIQHATLIYLSDDPVPLDQIDFQSTTLTIVPEPSTWLLLLGGLILPIRRRRGLP